MLSTILAGGHDDGIFSLSYLGKYSPAGGEGAGRGAAGEGGEGLVVEDPLEPAVALQLVVLQPQALEARQLGEHLRREAAQVVGVEGEGDQLGQA